MSLSRTDRLSRWITLTAFVLALVTFLVAPISALRWSRQPFPGFVVEQTLVVADYDGANWSGRLAGLGFPQRVTHLGGRAVPTAAEFNAILSSLETGGQVEVQTVLPDGSSRVVPAVQLGRFPFSDLARLFLLPYSAGLAYLAVGAWVYRVHGGARPGRAFAHFCAWTAITIGLIFDLITTHHGSALWTVAIAQEGGALVSLALFFPEEWPAVTRRPWLRLLPYGISYMLALWGVLVLYSRSDPWAYVRPWRASYIYAAIGIALFLGMMLYRLRTSPSAVARQQARIIVWGSLFAFVPLGVWLIAPLFGILSLEFNPLLFLPLLFIFPLSIGVAIVRYRLWDIDIIINRTVVYGLLSLVLASVYLGSVVLLQALVQLLTGQKQPEVVTVISTLVIAAAFNPARWRIRDLIDRRFYRSRYDAAKTLTAFGATLRDEVDLGRLVQRLEIVIGETIQPAHVLTWLRMPAGFGLYFFDVDAPAREWGSVKPANSEISADDPLVGYFRTTGNPVELDQIELDSPALARLRLAGVKLAVPLISQGELIGWLSLGPRLSEQGYSSDDRALLSNLAVQAASALRVAQLVREQQAEAQQRERLEHELGVARLIQQTLLPRELPSLSDWKVSVYWRPARAVGGDFYDFVPLPDGRFMLVVGDVADKGVPAALVMATTRVILKGTARRALSPAAALALANDLLYPELPAHMFVTCLYAILDPSNGRLVYANAGHNLPYRCCAGGVEELRATGMPLGMMPGVSYQEYETFVQPGEEILLVSDGLVEAHNPEHEMFGFTRLQQLMESRASEGDGLIETLVTELGNFTGEGWEQEDDVTVVLLQRL